ncbi:MAG: flagellar hook-length control protein FliK [Bdellovibrionota bacterium]
MVTKQIEAGSQSAKGGTPVVSQSAKNDELAKKFAAVLHGLLGGANLQSLVSSEQVPQVQAAAPLPEKEPEPEPSKTADEATPRNTESAERDTDETKKSSEDGSAQNTEAVAQASATVVQAHKPKTEVVEVKPEAVGEAVKEEVTTQAPAQAAPVVAMQTEVAESTAQHTETAVQAPVTPAQGTTPQQSADKPVAAAEQVAQPVEAQQVAQQGAADPAQTDKAVTSKQGGKQQSESYYAIQQALDGDNTEEPPAAVQPAVAQEAKGTTEAPKTRANAAEVLQGMMIRDAAMNERSGAALVSRGGSGANRTAELGGISGQGAVGDKIVGGKLKTGPLSAEINQQRIIDQVKDLLKKAVQSRDGNVLMVRLNPPELGELTVKVTQRDNQVYARIIPESKEVESMLRERANDVQQVLVHAGLKPDQVHVAIGTERSESEMFGFNQFLGGGQNGTPKDGGTGRENGSGNGAANGALTQGAEWTLTRNGTTEAGAESGWVA